MLFLFSARDFVMVSYGRCRGTTKTKETRGWLNNREGKLRANEIH